MRAFSEQYTGFANNTLVIRTLTDSTTTMTNTKRLTIRELRNIAKELKNAGIRFRGLYAFRFRLPTNLKLATYAVISKGTPRVPLLVGMSQIGCFDLLR